MLGRNDRLLLAYLNSIRCSVRHWHVPMEKPRIPPGPLFLQTTSPRGWSFSVSLCLTFCRRLNARRFCLDDRSLRRLLGSLL